MAEIRTFRENGDIRVEIVITAPDDANWSEVDDLFLDVVDDADDAVGRTFK